MPLTSHPNSNMQQGRILPRRIFPPGTQQPSGQPGQQFRRPMPQQQPPQNKGTSTQVKKPEEKSKNELDDVLKKLKDMGK
jgi:hypothetical protein